GGGVGGGAGPPRGAVRQGALLGQPGDGRVKAKKIPLQREMRLFLPPPGVVVVQAQASGYWSPPTVLVAHEGGHGQVHLWPTGTVFIPYRLPPQTPLPGAGSLRFPSLDPQGKLWGKVVCQVEPEYCRCPLPWGILDPFLRVPRFAREAFWEGEVKAGSPCHFRREPCVQERPWWVLWRR
ncbi:MAG: hypothetical protein N2447_09565, partial [Thermoanaerobaculum sp.]|nr:hypothetical protein [Thermoanaerobaculum sp.]